jgi:hypothetical protein
MEIGSNDDVVLNPGDEGYVAPVEEENTLQPGDEGYVAPEGEEENGEGDGLERPAADANAGKETPEPTVYEEDIKIEGLQYNGIDEVITVPVDIANSFSQAGLDINAVTTELYTDEFGLSAETTKEIAEKLKVPESMVTTAINGFAASNDLHQKTVADQAAAQKAASDEAWNETLEQVGSDANWNLMEKWAASGKWDQAKFDSFNNVMKSGDRYMQKLAIDGLLNDYQADRGSLDLTLVKGDKVSNEGSIGANGVLTYDQYQTIIRDGSYDKMDAEEQARMDQLRRNGQAKGL